MEADLSERVTKLTLELANGEVQTYAIHDNDGVMCLIISKEQNFVVNRGCCDTLSETGIVLLDELIRSAKALVQITGLNKWVQSHKN